jgi:hypothetical protein
MVVARGKMSPRRWTLDKSDRYTIEARTLSYHPLLRSIQSEVMTKWGAM